MVIPIDCAALSYHLLDFNLAVRPAVFFLVFQATSDFMEPVRMLGFVVFMAGSRSSRIIT